MVTEEKKKSGSSWFFAGQRPLCDSNGSTESEDNNMFNIEVWDI